MRPYAAALLPSRKALLFLHDEAVRKTGSSRVLMEEYFCLGADTEVVMTEVRSAVGRSLYYKI